MSEKDLVVKGRVGFAALPPKDWVVAFRTRRGVGEWIHSGLTEEEAKVLQKKYGQHVIAFKADGKV